jgi:radical SAM protein with 4Fe4S-binding SPASM domain
MQTRGRAEDIRQAVDSYGVFVKILERAATVSYPRQVILYDPLAHLLQVSYPELCRRVPSLLTDNCRCNWTEHAEIATNGDISFCRMGVVLGNIWRDDLADLWVQAPLLREIRARRPRGPCRDCPVWTRCRGGCPAIARSRCGEATAPEIACPARRRAAEPVS